MSFLEISSSHFFIALLGGIFPALIWLWFWLREDRKNPEPRQLIATAFIAGMIAVVITIPLQQKVRLFFPESISLIYIIWAAIEELVKYALAYFVALRTRFFNEPIDAVVYMATVALGFVALENTLYLIQPLIDRDIVSVLTTSNLRFMGASLLHVLSSATVGIFIAMTFYRSRYAKIVGLITGLFVAITLHALFNLHIIHSDTDGNILTIFLYVWIAIIFLLLCIEKIKSLTSLTKPRNYGKK